MGTIPASPAGRIQRQVVAVLSSLALAVLFVRHSAARKAEHRPDAG